MIDGLADLVNTQHAGSIFTYGDNNYMYVQRTSLESTEGERLVLAVIAHNVERVSIPASIVLVPFDPSWVVKPAEGTDK